MEPVLSPSSLTTVLIILLIVLLIILTYCLVFPHYLGEVGEVKSSTLLRSATDN